MLMPIIFETLDVNWSWSRIEMDDKIGQHQSNDTDEGKKGNKRPLWERFLGHLSSEVAHDQLLKFGERELPADGGGEAEKQCDC